MSYLAYERYMKEANEKEAKYFTVNENYSTQYIVPVTNKFYARHEAFNLNDADPDILKQITTVLDKSAREKYDWPMTENQRYGWFSKPLVAEHRNDERFYFPQKCSPITKAAIRIQGDKSMERPKFTGILWKF